jgi:hypothetical protein
VLLGTVLAQSAWIFALPPFRGTDEFNHVFRAASVARGDWRPHDLAKHGRGDLVPVPQDLIDAAHTQCTSLTYTLRNDCNPVPGTERRGEALIATSASRYNPAYYWVVGSAALPFHGTPALYVMRIVSALLCAILISLAAWCLTLWARSSWPFLGLLLALTPVTLFSTIVVAPNGLELCSALVIWSAALGLTRAKTGRAERGLLHAMVPAAIILGIDRPLGPGFLILAVVVSVMAQGLAPVAKVLRRHMAATATLVVAALAAIAANAYWLLTANLSQVSMHAHNTGALSNALRLIPVQFLQLFAAFPYRDVPAPPVVYACTVIVAAAALATGFAAARRRLRVVVLLTVLATFAGPFLFTLATYSTKADFWQGRYGLPFVFGVPILRGLALDRRPVRHRLVLAGAVLAVALLALAHTVSATHVLELELRRPASVLDPSWVHPGVWVIGFLMVAGWALYSQTLRRTEPSGFERH